MGVLSAYCLWLVTLVIWQSSCQMWVSVMASYRARWSLSMSGLTVGCFRLFGGMVLGRGR